MKAVTHDKSPPVMNTPQLPILYSEDRLYARLQVYFLIFSSTSDRIFDAGSLNAFAS